tara:strand:- start:227 stop:469 length:243 start_codon:yes stop_codon:yes gene_type:complete
MAFKMNGPSLYKSAFPKKTDKQKPDVDTTWVDQVYTKQKVNEALEKDGYHTEDGTRGVKNTNTGSKNVGGNNIFMTTDEL